MLRAGAGHAPRQDLAALLHEWLQHFHFLIVDEVHLLHAEAANLLLAKILPFAPPWRSASSRAGGPPLSWSSRGTRRPRCCRLLLAHRSDLNFLLDSILPALTGGRLLLRRRTCSRGGRRRQLARTAARAMLAMRHEFLLPLDLFVQPHGHVLDDGIGHL